MHSNITRNFLAGLLIAILSSTSFAGKIEDALTVIFDKAITSEDSPKAADIEKLVKENKPLSIELNNELKQVKVSMVKMGIIAPHISDFYDHFLIKKDASAELNVDAGTFARIYSSKTKIPLYLVDYKIIFSGEAIAAFAKSFNAPTIKAVVNNSESSSDCSTITESEEDEKAHRNPPTETNQSLCAPPTFAPKQTFATIQHLGKMVADIEYFLDQALTVVSHSDHIWTAVGTGTRGFFNLYNAITTCSLGDGLVAGADMLTAGMAGCRLFSALNKPSEKTQELFEQLNNNLELIDDASQEIAGVLSDLDSIITQVTQDLDKSIVNQSQKLKELLGANTKAGTLASGAVTLLTEAQRIRNEQSAQFESIKNAATKIQLGWTNLKNMLDNFGDKSDIKVQVENLKHAVEELKEPMALITEFLQTVASVNKQVNELSNKAFELILQAIGENTEMTNKIKCLSNENQSLQDIASHHKTSSQLIEKLGFTNETLEGAIQEAKKNSISLQKDFDKTYDLKHLLAGAGTAFACTFAITSPAVVVAVGLLTAIAVKEVDRGLSRSSCPQFNTRIGRLAFKCGVGEETIQNCGKRLGYSYEAK